MRNISHIDAIQTIKCLSLLIVVLERLECLSWFPWIRELRESHQDRKFVLNHVKWDADVSTKKEEEELNVLHMTIWRVLHVHLLYSYHLKMSAKSYAS